MSSDGSAPRYDLLVSGGGTAGMAAAIHAAQSGLSVVVFDAAGLNYDKPCGEGLMPPARAYLKQLGIDNLGGFEISGIEYVFADKKKITARFCNQKGLGIRRRSLRQALWARAAELGVIIREEATQHVYQTESSVHMNGFTACYGVIAEGLRSSTVHDLGLRRRRMKHSRFGMRQHFQMKPWNDVVEVWWGPWFEIYVTPVADNLINLAILADRTIAMQEVLASVPELTKKLANATPDDLPAGAGPLLHRIRKRRVGRLLFAGDAAGFVDAMTGEGNTLALGAGIAAVDAMIEQRLWSYPLRWWGIVWRYWILTRLAVWLAVRPWARMGSLSLLHKIPSLLQVGVSFLVGGR